MINGREGNSRRRSMVISILSGFTLLLLALTVFAVASQARSLSTQAERSVQTVENLRVVSIARAEMSIASRVAASSPEQLPIISGAIDNANASLDEVGAAFNEQTSPDTQAAFTDFRAAVDSQSEVLLDPEATAEARQDAEVAVGEAFTTLGSIMRSEQEAAIAGLEADNDLMNLIATISTFIVAFVVPSAALFVFQALRAAPRELRKLRFDHDRLARRSQAMATTIASESSRVRSAISNNPQSISRNSMHRTLARFEHIAVVNGAPTSLQSEQLDINDLLADVVDELEAEQAINLVKTDTPVTFTDSKNLRTIAGELIANAVEHGTGPRQVAAVGTPQGMELRVSDSGHGLPSAVVEAVVNEEDFTLREEALDGRFGYGLIAARQALDALGGDLRYERSEGETTLVAAIPTALLRGSKLNKKVQQAA